MRLCSSLPANRSVCARRARGEEVCRSRWTEQPPGGDFHLATSGDFEMAIDTCHARLRFCLSTRALRSAKVVEVLATAIRLSTCNLRRHIGAASPLCLLALSQQIARTGTADLSSFQAPGSSLLAAREQVGAV